MRYLFLLLGFLLSGSAIAQSAMTLEDCYTQAIESSPLLDKIPLIREQTYLKSQATISRKLPSMQLNAQASYQSDVTGLPISFPNFEVEEVPKDQYRAVLQVNQPIFTFGEITRSSNLQKAEGAVNQQQVLVALHHLKYRINEYFFKILLGQEQIDILKARQEQLKVRIDQVSSLVNNGVLQRTDQLELEVESKSIQQKIQAAILEKQNNIQSLQTLIGQDPDSLILKADTALSLPPLITLITRPEVNVFERSRDIIDARDALLSVKNHPKLVGFATLGYGNPALNMLENEFNPYYIVGAKIQWTPFDWNALKKERQAIRLKEKTIERDQADFERTVRINLDRMYAEMQHLLELRLSDREIVDLRQEILQKREQMLLQGTITPAEYVESLTELYVAKQELINHEVRFLLTKANYLITSGK